jgi:serine/threonine-protein kinase
MERMSEQNINKKAADPKNAALPEILARSAIHRKYQLGSVLCRDFAGTLYSTAISSQDGRETAVKVLNPGYALVSNTIGGIDHSRICKIRNIIIEHDKIQAVVHEKPNGKNLSTMLKEKGPLPVGEAVLAELQLLSAIHAVHWQGSTVGNLHADSIFISRDKQGNLELELANLGIGCQRDNLREQDYLAPEQIMGGRSASKKADIWAAGVIFYEMLMGKRPFFGDNRYAVAGLILLQELSFEGRDPKIPEELLSFIKHAMAKDEKDRFESVSDMVADLMPFQAEFNEPMSEAAAGAIHDSVPPSRAAGQAKGIVRAKAIPTVRISHTPSAPPLGLGSKKETGNNVPPALKTKLGMPSISLPAKHIPIKSKEDTSTFVVPKSEPPLDLTAYSARKARAGHSASPTPADGIPKETRLDFPMPALPIETVEVAPALKQAFLPKAKAKVIAIADLVKDRAVLPSATWIAARFAALSSKQKKIALGAIAGGVLLIVILAIAVGGKEISSTEVAPFAATPKPAASKPAASKPAMSTPASAAIKPAAVPENAAAALPSAKKVTISFKGKLPKDAVVRIDEVKVDSVPIVIDSSDKSTAVSITADGFKPFISEVVPSEDISINVDMKKDSSLPSAKRQKTQKPSQAKKKPKKKEKSGNALASNPFGG